MSTRLPTATCRPPTVAVDATAGDGLKAVTGATVRPPALGAADDRGGQRMLARRSTLAASVRTSSSVKPSAHDTVTSSGLPCVSVPVLSTTSVSTSPRSSMASAFLNSTPSVAPLPLATMIDIGVASPSAHGHAMISTATALTRAWARRGSGPTNSQTSERARRRRRSRPARSSRTTTSASR